MDAYNQQIFPMLSYEDGPAAMDWLCHVFGFTEKTRWLDDHGRLTHGELIIGNSMVMLASPTPDYRSPKNLRLICEAASKWYQTPYIINGVMVSVDDAEKHFHHAIEKGATILTGLESGGPGIRYRAEDLEGQRWMFIQAS
jgi:uncharacterized glyoxalase superfamily protein PhnB